MGSVFNTMQRVTICVWPDGHWCDVSELDEEVANGRSDDVLFSSVSAEISEELLYKFALQLVAPVNMPVGATVVALYDEPECFAAGDKAVIVRPHQFVRGMVLADFKNQGNPVVHDDGHWYLSNLNSVVI